LLFVQLNFLSVPSEDHLKGSKTKAAPTKKRSKAEAEDEEGVEDEDEPAKKRGKLNFEKGKMPSDTTIRKWAHAFCMCHDMEKATIKVAMKLAGEKFGVDMSEKKDLLKEVLSKEAEGE